MPDEDRAELRRQPPPALPDGSIPTYPAHPLPGMPGGGPRLPAFGWGPDFADDGESVGEPAEPSRRQRISLVASLLVICGAALAVLILVLATRTGDSDGTAPDASPAFVVGPSDPLRSPCIQPSV